MEIKIIKHNIYCIKANLLTTRKSKVAVPLVVTVSRVRAHNQRRDCTASPVSLWLVLELSSFNF